MKQKDRFTVGRTSISDGIPDCSPDLDNPNEKKEMLHIVLTGSGELARPQ